MPAIITAMPPSAPATPAAESWIFSSKASVPSSRLASGSNDICVDTAGASAPAWNELWLRVIPT